MKEKGVNEKILLFAIWLVSVAKIASLMVVDDPDLWGKITYGLKELSTGSILYVDQYSYTASGAPMINHEWLCEIIFALAWKNGGSFSLWAIRVILVGAALGIVLLLIHETSRGIWAGMVVYSICWFEMARGFAIRPQLFTYFFFPLLLFLIYRVYIQRWWSPWWTLAFIPIMALWANLHGGFLLGIVLLLWLTVYVAVEWRYGRMTRHELFPALFGFVSSFGATLINPYGISLWVWLVRSLRDPRGLRIPEWAPMYRFEPQAAVIGFYVIVVLSMFLFIGIRKKVNFFEWGLLAGLCAGAWVSNRNGVLFCTAAAIILPKYIEIVFPRLALPKGFHPLFIKTIVVLCSLYAVGIHFTPGHQPTTMLVETSKHPYNAIKFIYDNGLRGNLLVWFNWAQTAIWYLKDSCAVAFDGRYDAVYPKKVEDDYFHFNNLGIGWKNMIDNYNTQIILMPSDWPGIDLLKGQGDWQLVYRSKEVEKASGGNLKGENAVILIRRGAFRNFEEKMKTGDFVPAAARTIFRFGEPLCVQQR